MTKKTYIAPNINIVEMTCTSMIAASGGDVTESETGGAEGNLGGSTGGSGDSWSGAQSSSRIYFDSWTDDEEEY